MCVCVPSSSTTRPAPHSLVKTIFYKSTFLSLQKASCGVNEPIIMTINLKFYICRCLQYDDTDYTDT